MIKEEDVEVTPEEVAALSTWDTQETVLSLQTEINGKAISAKAFRYVTYLADELGLPIKTEYGTITLKREKTLEERQKIVRTRKFHQLRKEEEARVEAMAAEAAKEQDGENKAHYNNGLTF